MQVYETWQGIKGKHPRIVVGLGNFDGVHLGHRKLIESLVAAARETGGTPAVFTFYPHPMAVLCPGQAPPLLLTQEAKGRMMNRLGVAVLLRVPFTMEFARLEPQAFIEEVLVDNLGIQAVFAGYNYTFGHRGRGNPELLLEYGRRYSFDVHVVPPVEVDGRVISSTLIRGLLMDGDVAGAKKYLGYTPFVEGTVVAGERRGNTLGFPTANLEPEPDLLLPANGVYAVRVLMDGDSFLGVANVGVKPTFHGNNHRRNVEVHLLDFHGDLYGCWMLVRFERRLRAERRFASPGELVAQIRRDIVQARGVE
ncbi:bifunctional riboflavin kinase/FAD synthetase [Desulfotomaculum copahuensis]|uniref:Riboflavin biosynthesis protein n=1 Tax=Desulfotomaculum copahuensis TaxID=1838280 RepID=A0A1B7LHU3_9FIRM|nr:bifunctional riboflavin kinase/FAD synthetase [Desulfotomaculum copahuensis]OAT85871.1 riboflavin biosynthesis protein RibF [Desulfotomaculum copahuensis]